MVCSGTGEPFSLRRPLPPRLRRRLPDGASDKILVESVADGWLWKIPLKGHISSVGVVADRDSALKAIRAKSLESWFDDVLTSSDYTSSFLEHSEPVGPCTATRDWSYQANHFTGPRHCLIGDAACFIDPLFSTGVHLAIYSATIGAALVSTTLNTPNLAKLAADAFEREYRQHYGHFRELARLFYGSNRSVDSYFWQTRQITGEDQYSPRAAFVRAVSGQTSSGYERTTLSHGVLPIRFLDELTTIETNRRERQASFSDFHDATELTVEGDATIERVALFAGEAFEAGQVVRRKGLDDIPISPFVADVVALLQKPSTTISQLAEALASRGWSSQQIASSLPATLQLLYVEGVIH